MIGVNLNPEDKYYVHKTCSHCGQLVYPDENGKIHVLERNNAINGSSFAPICEPCLEKMVKREGLWAK